MTLARLALLLAFLGGWAHAQQFTMKLSTPTINDVSHEWMKVFKDNVEKRSAGKIKVEIYPANQLGQIPRTVEGVALGTLEMTVPAVGFLIGLEPRFQVFDAPGLFEDVEHAQRVFTDPEVKSASPLSAPARASSRSSPSRTARSCCFLTSRCAGWRT